MFTVQFNDGRVLSNIPSGEARMWLLLSIEAISCNVYHTCGSGAAVCYID